MTDESNTTDKHNDLMNVNVSRLDDGRSYRVGNNVGTSVVKLSFSYFLTDESNVADKHNNLVNVNVSRLGDGRSYRVGDGVDTLVVKPSFSFFLMDESDTGNNLVSRCVNVGR